MKKRVALAIAVIFIFGLFYGVAQKDVYAKEYKIGYVDLAKVFEEYKRTKESEKILTDRRKIKEDDRKKMVDELRKLKDEQALLSDKAKAEKQTVLDNKIKVLQDFDIKTRDELLKDRNDLLGGILKDIEKVVADYAKEKGYDLILNSRVLLYGSDQYDVTTEILGKLNK
jgi:outer membrane protein